MFIYPRNNGYWYIHYKEGGKKVDRSLHTKNKAVANTLFRNFKNQNDTVRLTDLKVRVMQAVEHNGGNSRFTYNRTMDRLIEYLNNDKLTSISRTDLENFLNSFRFKNNTINSMITVLKRAFDIALEKKWITENPAVKIKYRPSTAVLVWIEDIQQFLDCAEKVIRNRQYYLAIKLGILTGMRKAEIAKLKWSQIDLKEGTISLFNKITRKPELVYFNPAEVMPIFDELRKSNIISSQGYVWGKKFGTNINSNFNKVRDLLGLPKELHFHCSRHTAITNWANKGLSVNELKGLARHSSLSVTNRYVHTTHEQLKRAVRNG